MTFSKRLEAGETQCSVARSTFDLFAIIKQIVDAKAQFRSLAEPWADTGTSTGDLMLAVLGGLGDVERDLERAPPKAGATPRSGWRGTEPLSAAGSVWHRVDWSYWGYWHWHCVPIAHVYHLQPGHKARTFLGGLARTQRRLGESLVALDFREPRDG